MSGDSQSNKRATCTTGAVRAVTIAGAARRLQVCQETVRRRCDSGEIPHIKNEWGARIILSADLEVVARKRGL
jgi:hypothetical protein